MPKKAAQELERGIKALSEAFGDEDPNELPGMHCFKTTLKLLRDTNVSRKPSTGSSKPSKG